MGKAFYRCVLIQLLLLTVFSLNAQTVNKVLQETFLGGGSKLENIDWSQTPASTAFIDNFETAINTANDYGVRLTAEVTIPSDGNFTFYIASDDQGELQLSTTNSANDLVTIGVVDGWISSYNWTANASQKSATYNFTAGQKILLVARMKEKSGGDHLQIGWSINQGAITVIPGSVCNAPATSPVPDEELVEEEEGLVLYEKWNTATSDLSTFDYTVTPDETSNIIAFDQGLNIGNNYVSRMTAVVAVPKTGIYIFYCASDDDSELFVSVDGNIANATKIASVNGWVSPLDWTKSSSQQSVSFNLVAGQQIAIQLTHRDGNSLDNAAVGWSIDGGAIEVIKGIYDPWLTNSALEVNAPTASQVSPVWVEGRVGAVANAVTVTVDGGTAFDANLMGDTRFYASNSSAALGVTLNPTASIALSITNGVNTSSQSITWTPTDIATGSGILIRKGDSLLLTANGTGASVEIDTDWDSATFTANLTGAPGQNFVQQFNTAGTFFLQAKIDGVIVGTYTVSVADVNLNGPIACEIGYEREKTVNVVGVNQDLITFASSDDGNGNLELSLNRVTSEGVVLKLLPLKVQNESLVARINGDTGPVIAIQEVEEFDLSTQATQYIAVVEEFSDGSMLVEANLEMLPKILGIQVNLHIFVSGVTFDDATLDKTIMTDSFDNSSPALFPYQMIMDAGVTTGSCHTIKIYQNNVQIGD